MPLWNLKLVLEYYNSSVPEKLGVATRQWREDLDMQLEFLAAVTAQVQRFFGARDVASALRSYASRNLPRVSESTELFACWLVWLEVPRPAALRKGVLDVQQYEKQHKTKLTGAQALPMLRQAWPSVPLHCLVRFYEALTAGVE